MSHEETASGIGSGFDWKWGAIYAVILVISAFVFLIELPGGARRIEVTQANFTEGAQSGPVSNAQSQLVTLPHNWRVSDKKNSEGWYHANFHVQDPLTERWSIHLVSHRSNAAIYINDRFIGDGGRFEPPVARNAMRPFLFPIPDQVLKQGQNRIAIRLVADPPGHGYLGEVYIGANKDVRLGYRLQSFALVSVQQIATFLIFAFSAFMIALWMGHKTDRAYGFFGGMTVAWTIHNLNTIVTEIPVSLNIWDRLIYISMLWLVTFAVMFAREFVGKKPSRFDMWFPFCAIGLTTVLLFLPFRIFHEVANAAMVPLELALGVYAVGLLALRSIGSHELQYRLITAAGLVVVLYAVHDALVITNVITNHIYYLLPFSEFVLLGTLGLILLNRFLESIREVEDLNANLEARVLAKENELSEAFASRRELERQNILSEERQRIIREIHDGVGGHLVSILAMAEKDENLRGEVSQSARNALSEMRLTISSLGLESGDLPTLLGAFREHSLAPLEATGLEMDWNVAPVSPVKGMGPRMSIHILRILQEALANAIKHANTYNIEVILRERASAVILEFINHGAAKESSDSGGRGLLNMQARAEEIGADLEVSQKTESTIVSLSLEKE